jgi:hypothetical protein
MTMKGLGRVPERLSDPGPPRMPSQAPKRGAILQKISSSEMILEINVKNSKAKFWIAPADAI